MKNMHILLGDYSPAFKDALSAKEDNLIEERAESGVNFAVDLSGQDLQTRKNVIDIANKYGYKIVADVFLPIRQDMPSLKEGFHEINTYLNGVRTKKDTKVLIASTNQGKIEIYSNIFKKLNIEFCSLRDLNPHINVAEDGKDELENALLKAKAYHEATLLPVLANDSGLIIEKFSKEDQPGVFVRRYGGKELTDQETIRIFSKKLEEVGGSSDGYFNVALAICDQKGDYHTRLFKSDRHFVSTPSKVVTKGLPLRSLDYSKRLGKYMSEMTIEEANGIEGECIEQQRDFIKEYFGNF